GAVLVGVAAPLLLRGNYELAIGLGVASLLGVFATWDIGGYARTVAAAGAGLMIGLVRREVRIDRIDALYIERNFYGTLQVTQDTSDRYRAVERTLYNGIIEHGQEVFRADLA